MTRGYFAIGVFHPKKQVNTGTLWRSAACFGAAFTFTVGERFTRQSSDTMTTDRHCPMFRFDSVKDLVTHLPHGCPLIGVELCDGAHPMDRFVHPERACYLLGAEDHGLTPDALAACHHRVVIPHCDRCLNVAVAGSIAMYDRVMKSHRGAA